MDALAAKSNALLESLDAAREAERAATEEVEQAARSRRGSRFGSTQARAVVREWVFLVYSGGGGGSDVAFMIEAMASEAEDVGDPIADLSYLTEERTRALQDVRVLTAEQSRLSAAAAAAKAEAVSATCIAGDSSEAQKTSSSSVPGSAGLASSRSARSSGPARWPACSSALGPRGTPPPGCATR